MVMTHGKIFIIVILVIVSWTPIDCYSSTCFVNRTLSKIPASHVYYRVSKPAIIGYKGNILSYQENTLEGIKSCIDLKLQGVHMQVQATFDDKLIVFGDKNLNRLIGIDVAIRYLNFDAISGLKLKTQISIHVNKTQKYSKSPGIPLLEDVLKAIKGKGLLIYIELVPSDAPPVSPLERDHALRVGREAAKLVRRLDMINEVFVVSSDPFKLLAVNHYDSDIVTGWWFKGEFYHDATIGRMRQEFTDLNGLRNCYIKTAPTGVEFAPFLYETGIVTKSVNGSLFDTSFDIIDNSAYLSGRQDRTIDVLKKNYNPQIHFGGLLMYFDGQAARNRKADIAKMQSFVEHGMDRVITDDPSFIVRSLTSVGSNAHAIHGDYLIVTFCFVAFVVMQTYVLSL